MGKEKLNPTMDYKALSNVLCQTFILEYGLDCLGRMNVLINNLMPLRKEEWVLDVGTSAGDYLFDFEDKTDFVCLDLSLSALRLLKKRANRIFLVLADAQKPPFKSETFNGIIAGDVMEHLREDRIFFNEMSYILKKEGILSLSVPYGEKLTSRDIRAGHLRRYNKATLKEFCEVSKFKIVYITSWGFPITKLYDLAVRSFLKLYGEESFASEGNLKFVNSLANSIVFKVYFILLPLLKRLVNLDYAFRKCGFGDWLILKAVKMEAVS
jgi:SAM-dependent methyltransferase